MPLARSAMRGVGGRLGRMDGDRSVGKVLWKSQCWRWSLVWVLLVLKFWDVEKR